MEKETIEITFLDPKNQADGIWIIAKPEELQFNSPEMPKILKEIEKLEAEINNFQTRIDQEIALTEKITDNIKSRASNPKDVNVLRDVELQWRTTYANIENIKKMMLPRTDKVQELYKKLTDEKNNIIKSLRNDYLDKLITEINALNEGLNYLNTVIHNIATISKTISLIDKETNAVSSFEAIKPNPIDSFEIFNRAYNEYINKIRSILEK